MALQSEPQPPADWRLGPATERYVTSFLYCGEQNIHRCVIVAVMPMATEMAGVDMRLEAGAIR